MSVRIKEKSMAYYAELRGGCQCGAVGWRVTRGIEQGGDGEEKFEQKKRAPRLESRAPLDKLNLYDSYVNCGGTFLALLDVKCNSRTFFKGFEAGAVDT